MHTATNGYLDCCPEVYEKIEWSLQEALEKAVAKEIAIALKKDEVHKEELVDLYD